jgi:hypothetical protein
MRAALVLRVVWLESECEKPKRKNCQEIPIIFKPVIALLAFFFLYRLCLVVVFCCCCAVPLVLLGAFAFYPPTTTLLIFHLELLAIPTTSWLLE